VITQAKTVTAGGGVKQLALGRLSSSNIYRTGMRPALLRAAVRACGVDCAAHLALEISSEPR
jgi:hypothetical protein